MHASITQYQRTHAEKFTSFLAHFRLPNIAPHRRTLATFLNKISPNLSNPISLQMQFETRLYLSVITDLGVGLSIIQNISNKDHKATILGILTFTVWATACYFAAFSLMMETPNGQMRMGIWSDGVFKNISKLPYGVRGFVLQSGMLLIESKASLISFETTVHVSTTGTKLSISKYERYQEKVSNNSFPKENLSHI